MTKETIREAVNKALCSGELEWNHHEGDEVGKKPLSAERIVTFIDQLHTKEMKRLRGEVEKLPMYHRLPNGKEDGGYVDFVDKESVLALLTDK